MLGFPTQIRYLLFPLIFSAVLIALHFGPQFEFLIFEVSKIKDGEIWRILSGQLLHSNENHLYLNLAGLALVWAIHGEYYRYEKFVFVLCQGLVAVGIFTVIFSTTNIYFGLSGVLHYLLTWGACIDIAKLDKPLKTFKINTFYHHTGFLLLLGLIIKVIYENVAPNDLELAATIGASVAVEVHAIGVITALVIYTMMIKIQKKGRVSDLL